MSLDCLVCLDCVVCVKPFDEIIMGIISSPEYEKREIRYTFSLQIWIQLPLVPSENYVIICTALFDLIRLILTCSAFLNIFRALVCVLFAAVSIHVRLF